MAAVTELRRYRDDVGAKASAPIPARLMADGYDEIADAGGATRALRVRGGRTGDGAVLATLPVPGGAVQVLPSEAFDPDEAGGAWPRGASELEEEIERAEQQARQRGVRGEGAGRGGREAEREKLEALERLQERGTRAGRRAWA